MAKVKELEIEKVCKRSVAELSLAENETELFLLSAISEIIADCIKSYEKTNKPITMTKLKPLIIKAKKKWFGKKNGLKEADIFAYYTLFLRLPEKLRYKALKNVKESHELLQWTAATLKK